MYIPARNAVKSLLVTQIENFARVAAQGNQERPGIRVLNSRFLVEKLAQITIVPFAEKSITCQSAEKISLNTAPLIAISNQDGLIIEKKENVLFVAIYSKS